jgi:hypothetical protein
MGITQKKTGYYNRINKVASNGNTDGIDNTQRSEIGNKVMQIGRVANDYEQNLRILNGGISNPTDQEIQEAKDGIKWYEDYIAIAYNNAAKSGVSIKDLDNYTQQCKECFEEWLNAEMKNLQIVIHGDGTMTSTNTRTNEVARFDNQGNPIG